MLAQQLLLHYAAVAAATKLSVAVAVIDAARWHFVYAFWAASRQLKVPLTGIACPASQSASHSASHSVSQAVRQLSVARQHVADIACDHVAAAAAAAAGPKIWCNCKGATLSASFVSRLLQRLSSCRLSVLLTPFLLVWHSSACCCCCCCPGSRPCWATAGAEKKELTWLYPTVNTAFHCRWPLSCANVCTEIESKVARQISKRKIEFQLPQKIFR